MTESTFSVNTKAAERIVKELSKAGINTSLGTRHGDATIINISPEQRNNASEIKVDPIVKTLLAKSKMQG